MLVRVYRWCTPMPEISVSAEGGVGQPGGGDPVELLIRDALSTLISLESQWSTN
jgi:hypothetical protein